MEIHNCLPILLDCLKRWENAPTREQYVREYAMPLEARLGESFRDFYPEVEGLNWAQYREETLTLDPAFQEDRLRQRIRDVEKLFGFPLHGEAILLGAFTAMDGFARFDSGAHRVFLGVDENHGRGRYLDILITHELTHVARETRPEVWLGWGMDPKMPRDTYLNSMPAIEHLLSEGLSCVVSELLITGEDPWSYVYLTQDGLEHVVEHGPALDRVIHRELRKEDGGEFYGFYDENSYRPPLPVFSHYLWAWQWVKQLLRKRAGGDIRRLVSMCSKELVQDALAFRLKALRETRPGAA